MIRRERSDTVVFLCLRQDCGRWGHYVFTTSRCPDVNVGIFSLHMHEYWTDFGEIWGGNHYHQPMNWLHFSGRNCTMNKGARYDRKFESTSNQCCHVANGFTNFTVGLHTTRCVRSVGKSITHMQRRRHHMTASSIAGVKMIPLPPYKAPRTQSRLPSPTKTGYSDF